VGQNQATQKKPSPNLYGLVKFQGEVMKFPDLFVGLVGDFDPWGT